MDDTHLINSDERITPRYSLANSRRSLIKCVIERKKCVLCNQFFINEEFPEHVSECTGPDNTPPDSPIVDQIPIPDQTENSTTSENLLPNESSRLTQLPDDDDYSKHAVRAIEFEENRSDLSATPFQERTADEESIDDQTTTSETNDNDDSEHLSNDIELKNHLSDSPPSSVPEPMVNDHIEHPDNLTELENDNSDGFESLEEESVVNDKHLDDPDSVTEIDTTPAIVILPPIEPLEINDELSNQFIQRSRSISNGDIDVYHTPKRMSPVRFDENSQKFCILCQKKINQSEFYDHIKFCSDIPSTVRITTDEPQRRYSTDDDQDRIENPGEQLKACIICFKPIRESEYIQHVHACLPESPTSEPVRKPQAITCFSCHHRINLEDNLSREISCPSRHIYCLPCLQYSMEKFARTRSIPLCHLTLCDYELSRYDISFIPLERRTSDRLFQLAKGQQRPLCSKCQFYIDAHELEDYYDHIDRCDGRLTRCKYCSCPYSIDELDEDHETECRRDRSSRNDKLVHFITKRTKYPFTKEQIRIFIQQEGGEAGDLDPLMIVQSLAIFGPVFPFDIPTKICDVCIEACPYEDIYVFDCPDSHKLCYQCYYQSCATKMSNGELLTCGLCATSLRDGELNQLRISTEERRKFRDYQMKKTLDAYSNHTRGVIKCPNQSCTWLAEAEDPTQRFKVQCPMCKREFCSLCNQQYHYRTTCQQLPHITQQWYLWCQTERARYLTMRAGEDEAYAAQLNDYNRQMQENEHRNRDLRRRYEELVRDEQYKVQNCRLCPSCKRVVQRLEGCDTMICGRDVHGGNIQSGCGTKFNWLNAQPYIATNALQSKESVINLPEPELPVVQHIGVQCDRCHNNVMGIRFDCVHCPTLTYCEKCEQQATLNHSKDNQRMKQQSHVFRLIMTPEEVSS